jgi:hypothetical protein
MAYQEYTSHSPFNQFGVDLKYFIQKCLVNNKLSIVACALSSKNVLLPMCSYPLAEFPDS